MNKNLRISHNIKAHSDVIVFVLNYKTITVKDI